MVTLVRWAFRGVVFAAVIGATVWMSGDGLVGEAGAQTCMSFDTSRSAAAASKVVPKMVLHSDGDCAAVRPGAVLRTVSLAVERFEGQAPGLRGFRGPRGPRGPRGITPPAPVCVME